MTWDFVLAQGCGLVVLVLAILTPQFKKIELSTTLLAQEFLVIFFARRFNSYLGKKQIKG